MRTNVMFAVSFLTATFIAGAIHGNTLSVRSGEGVRGTTGNVVFVDLTNEHEIWALLFDVVYDSMALIAVEVDSTARSDHFAVFLSAVYPGLTRVLMFDTTLTMLPPGSGSIAEISFFVADDALPGIYPLNLQNVQMSDTVGVLPVVLIDGSFRVTVVLDSLQVQPRSVEVACADTQRFTAIGYDTAGTPVPLVPAWAVIPAHLGQIEPTGLFTAHRQGEGWIEATYETWADSVSVGAVHGLPVAVDVEPDSAVVVSGGQQLYSAVGTDECNNSFSADVTWVVHPAGIGTIDSTGLFTAITAGEGWIVASGSAVDSAFVTVTTGALASIDIFPDSAILACADTIRFSAQGRDRSGNIVSITPDWSVIPRSRGTVDPGGLFVASGAGEGWVVASQDGISDSAYITVQPGSLAMLDIQPDSVVIRSGQSQQFAALGSDACGNSLAVEPQWSVLPPGLGVIGSDGLFIAQGEGEGWVYAAGSVRDSAHVIVERGPTATLTLSPPHAHVAPGDAVFYTATANDGYNTWDVTEFTVFSTTDPGGSFSDNMYIAGVLGTWEIIGVYSFHTVIFSDTVHVTVSDTAVCERGDVNCDEAITPGDALCAFWRSISGEFQPECECECSEESAEINCDGAITPADALCIFRRSILGEWPEECECAPSAKTLIDEKGIVSSVCVRSVRARPESTVRIPVSVEDPHNFDAFGMQLIYPSHLLNFEMVSPTPATEEWTVLDGIVTDPGIVTLGGFHTEPISSAARVVLLEAVFNVKDGATGGGEFDVINLVDDVKGTHVERGHFVVEVEPTTYALHQNYPNPFNPTTSIQYSVVGDQSRPHVTLKIYNVLGQEVRTLADEAQEPGYYSVTWDGKDNRGRDVPSGVYFCRITAAGTSPHNRGEFTATRRMVLMK